MKDTHQRFARLVYVRRTRRPPRYGEIVRDMISTNWDIAKKWSHEIHPLGLMV